MASMKEPRATWHYDWRGRVYVNALRFGAAACVGLVIWSLHHFIH